MKRRDFMKGILAGAAIAAAPRILSGLPELPQLTRSMINDGEFHHYAYVFDKGNIIFYFDGNQTLPIDKAVDVTWKVLMEIIPKKFHPNKSHTGSYLTWSRYNTGVESIDNTAMWERALTFDEVQELLHP